MRSLFFGSEVYTLVSGATEVMQCLINILQLPSMTIYYAILGASGPHSCLCRAERVVRGALGCREGANKVDSSPLTRVSFSISFKKVPGSC